MEEALISPAARMRNRRIEQALAEQQGRLRAFVRREVGDLEAEDIVQEVLYELIVAYDLMQPIQHLAAWMMRVARNRIIDRWRSRAAAGGHAVREPERLLEALELPRGSGPEAEYARHALADELEQSLAELPAHEREVFVAHEIEGVSFRELAQKTGININTLLGRKHAAVAHLRRRLRLAYQELED